MNYQQDNVIFHIRIPPNVKGITIRKNTSFSSEKMTSEINDSGNNDQRMEYQ